MIHNKRDTIIKKINLEIQDIIRDIMFKWIIKRVYCVCCDVDGDKRILINHGIFIDEHVCTDYVNKLNSTKNNFRYSN